ncbi:MAG: hypothetical protein IH624_05895 [Phycisphaerae bacterium]|nr:hypothetical protein [Phycisphaerae bacterium]
MSPKKRGQIHVVLPEGWRDYSADNPDGPTTFLRDASEVSGALQISVALHNGGPLPNPSKEDLVDMASSVGYEMQAGKLVETANGECAFGLLGSATFHSTTMPHTRIWYLSDGQDFVMATHICADVIDPQELSEAGEIVKGLVLQSRSGGLLGRLGQLWRR